MTKISFLPNNVTIEAEPGESILAVAQRAGVFIPTGCLMGSCHACEVEIDEELTICACITSVPEKRSHLTVNISTDPTW